MFNELLAFAETAISEAYPLTPCYREYRPQDFARPSFTLAVAEGRLEHILDRRYALTCTLEIRYYAPLLNDESEVDLYERLHDTAMILYDVLEYPYAKAMECRHKIEQKTLVFTATYKIYVEKTGAAADLNDAPKMTALTLAPDIVTEKE